MSDRFGDRNLNRNRQQSPLPSSEKSDAGEERVLRVLEGILDGSIAEREKKSGERAAWGCVGGSFCRELETECRRLGFDEVEFEANWRDEVDFGIRIYPAEWQKLDPQIESVAVELSSQRQGQNMEVGVWLDPLEAKEGDQGRLEEKLKKLGHKLLFIPDTDGGHDGAFSFSVNAVPDTEVINRVKRVLESLV
jgi:hypothetical protein